MPSTQIRELIGGGSITITKLASYIAIEFGFTLNDLQGDLRYAYLQQLRQGTTYVLRQFDFLLKDVAIALKRDKTSIAYYEKQARITLTKDEEFAKQVAKSIAMISEKISRPINTTTPKKD